MDYIYFPHRSFKISFSPQEAQQFTHGVLNKHNEYVITAGEIRAYPKAVTDHWYFKLALRDKLVTIVESSADPKLEVKQAEAEAAEAKRQEEVRNSKRLADARKAAKDEATKLADAEGLDQTSKKAFIKKYVDEAIAKLGEDSGEK